MGNTNTLTRISYNFTQLSDLETELNIYDEIASKRTRDWWTGEETGTQVTPDIFKNELDSVSTPEITVRINSGGGEVTSANTIAVAIEEARARGKKIKCKIDGMCASAAVQIAMACESVAIHSGAYMMIHNPMSFVYGYYNVNELKETINFLNTIKKGIMDSYIKKTGKTEKEISKMMDVTTWMTGSEAVENGFADSIMFEDETEEEVINRISQVAINSVYDIPKQLKNKLEKKGERNMENVINSIEDLRKAYPDLVNQLEQNATANVSHDEAVKNAVNAERERMKAIDEMTGKVDSEILNKAKYETFDTAEKVAFNAIKNGNFVNTGILNAMRNESVATDGIKVVANSGNAGNVDSKVDATNKAAEIAKAYFDKNKK